jgi:hypothetical protein
MDIDSFLTVALPILSVVLILGLTVLVYYYRNKKLPSTIEEFDEIIEDYEENKAFAEKLLAQVLAFFDRETPMSATSIETINHVIPSASYKMTSESKERILNTCASEGEKDRICAMIVDYEEPISEGDECCIYTIETTNAIFKVQWGVPELISDKEVEYKPLTQVQCNEIVQLLDKTEPFYIMWQIMKSERDRISEYFITDGVGVVNIKDGIYTYEIVK